MKNIHILPTNKPSKLQLQMNGNFHIENGQIIALRSYENIYITSDEEIKYGDWVYCLKEAFEPILKQKVNPIGVNNDEMMKKIILTTDQDLIKDGVQAIDDEFLEWFVKNPSCEEVEIEKYHGINTSIAEVSSISGNDDYNWQGKGDFRDYKIIIPKEEAFKHKVEALSKEEILANRSNAYDFIDFDKQETLEEAIEEELSFIHNSMRSIDFDLAFKTGGVIGAKWQQERMYSEEDMKQAFNVGRLYLGREGDTNFEQFIEQFKNK